MKLQKAEYIITIAQAGSISAAAKKLFISQPALSQIVKQVEELYGIKLFTRSNHQLCLTFAGQRYVQTAQQMMSLERNFLNAINDISSGSYGLLRFGCPVQQSISVLPLILPGFQARFPRVQLQVEERSSNVLEQMVLDGELDIVMAGSNCSQKLIHYHLLEKDSMGLLAGKNTRLAQAYPNGTQLDITAAKDEAFIFRKAGNSRSVQDALASSMGIKLHPLVEVNNFETAKQLVMACNAVMVAPYSLLTYDNFAKENAYFYPLRHIGYERHFYVCYRHDLHITQYMAEWISSICRLYNKTFEIV